jgi:inosine/xanthosine triphosphatase
MPVPDLNIAVASTNPVKLAAARNGLALAFPSLSQHVQGYSLETTIPDQPLSDLATYQGAMERISLLRALVPDADYWVGIEGGVEKQAHGGYDSFAWIVLQHGEQQYSSCTSTFPLPPAVCRLLDEGMELGDADDVVFGSTQSKQQNGAIGLLTQNQITRTDLLAQSVFLASIPFQSPELYQTNTHP